MAHPCGVHKVSFPTLGELKQHRAEADHTTRVTDKPCVMCKLTVPRYVFTGKFSGKVPVLCEACKTKLREGL